MALVIVATGVLTFWTWRSWCFFRKVTLFPRKFVPPSELTYGVENPRL